MIIEPISIENELETRLKTILESVGENDFVGKPFTNLANLIEFRNFMYQLFLAKYFVSQSVAESGIGFGVKE